MIETENNGDFSKWPYTVMQTLDDRIGEPRGYKMIPLEDRKQGLEKECVAPKNEYFMSENPDLIF